MYSILLMSRPRVITLRKLHYMHFNRQANGISALETVCKFNTVSNQISDLLFCKVPMPGLRLV